MMKPKKITVDIGNKAWNMEFDHLTMAIAEQAYERINGMTVNASGVVARAIAGEMGAMMALGYAALMSAGEKLSWQTFVKGLYPQMDVDWWADTVSHGLMAMFGESDDAGEEKN